MTVDAKEEIKALQGEIEACEKLREYWEEKERQANSAVGRYQMEMASLREKLAAEISQVSA